MSRTLLGLGVDIVHIPRIARLAQNRRLLERICAPDERHHIPDDEISYARTWATKEAVAKTLGTGFWQSGVEWREVCIGPHWRVILQGRALMIAGPSVFDLKADLYGDYLTVSALRWSGPATD